MVAIKNVFLLGISLASAVPWSGSTAEGTSVIEARYPSDQVGQSSHQADTFALEKRVPGKATLQYTRQGVIFFNLGLQLPSLVLRLIANTKDIAEQLAYEFLDFAVSKDEDVPVLGNILMDTTVGGLYSAAPDGDLSYGVGVVLRDGVTEAERNEVIAKFIQWMSSGGGLVKVIERANGALDPAAIGYVPSVIPKLRRRTRQNFCASGNQNLIQYAIASDPVTHDLRWVSECHGA